MVRVPAFREAGWPPDLGLLAKGAWTDARRLGAHDHLTPLAAAVQVPVLAPRPGAPSVCKLLDLLDGEEQKVAARTFVDRVSTLRKIFYTSWGWNHVLVPGTADVPAPYAMSDVPLCGDLPSRLALPGGHVPLARVQATAVDAHGHVPPVAQCQEALLPAGWLVDVGHALCGLDAAAHPAPVGLPGLAGIRHNVDAATWAGDLGSWLAEVQIAAANGADVTPPLLESLRLGLAPAEDMLGNLDAFALSPGFEAATPHDRVVPLLRAFYLAPFEAGPRVREAAGGLGLGSFANGRFEHEDAFVAAAADDVAAAASLYFLTLVDGSITVEVAQFAVGLSCNDGARVLVRAFVDGLIAQASCG
jgi:hypothetical protein